jgi:hypothetical protein
MLSARALPSTPQMMAVARPVSAPARTSNRFSRLLLGDGQQKVHPFPTLRTRANP